jgi:hypothetical protein
MSAHTLRWDRRVLTADDLHRSLDGHREILLPARAVITPLAAEHLRHTEITVRAAEEAAVDGKVWAVLSDRPSVLVRSAVEGLTRERLAVKEGPAASAREAAGRVARGEWAGAVIFTAEPELACCVANKVPGVRAVSVSSIGQMKRVAQTVVPNVVAVEMPGRTFFEVRQVIRECCLTTGREVPALLREPVKQDCRCQKG